MTRPMTANLRSDGGSFKDSAGRVCRVSGEAGDERILRGLDQAAAATLEKLLGYVNTSSPYPARPPYLCMLSSIFLSGCLLCLSKARAG